MTEPKPTEKKEPTPKQVRDQYLEDRTLPKGWAFTGVAPDLVKKIEKYK